MTGGRPESDCAYVAQPGISDRAPSTLDLGSYGRALASDEVKGGCAFGPLEYIVRSPTLVGIQSALFEINFLHQTWVCHILCTCHVYTLPALTHVFP